MVLDEFRVGSKVLVVTLLGLIPLVFLNGLAMLIMFFGFDISPLGGIYSIWVTLPLLFMGIVLFIWVSGSVAKHYGWT